MEREDQWSVPGAGTGGCVTMPWDITLSSLVCIHQFGPLKSVRTNSAVLVDFPQVPTAVCFSEEPPHVEQMLAALCSCGSSPDAGHGNSGTEGLVTVSSADFASIVLHLLKKYKGPAGTAGTGDCWLPGVKAVAFPCGGNKDRHWGVTPAGHLQDTCL